MNPPRKTVRTHAEREARDIAREEKKRRRVRDALTGRVRSPDNIILDRVRQRR